MTGIGFRLSKSMFFDRPAVISAVDRGTRRVLSKFGAFVRTTARRSIKRPGKRSASRISLPGDAPYSHEGSLKRLIYFGFDPNRRSVVIGPVPFREAEAPELLEYGGTARRTTRDGKRVTARYQPRPFMGPAFSQEQPKLPQMWRDSVTPGLGSRK